MLILVLDLWRIIIWCLIIIIVNNNMRRFPMMNPYLNMNPMLFNMTLMNNQKRFVFNNMNNMNKIGKNT
jgi:hypothetical protein